MRRVMARKEDAPLGVAKEEVWGMPMASPRT